MHQMESPGHSMNVRHVLYSTDFKDVFEDSNIGLQTSVALLVPCFPDAFELLRVFSGLSLLT